jgi:hypothetical protein
MALFALAGLAFGDLGPLARNTTKDAAFLALAFVGLAVRMADQRIGNVYLVGLGLLLLADAFMGLSRGVFYLDFIGLQTKVEPLQGAARLWASAADLIFGASALYYGLVIANREAKSRLDADAPKID